MDLNTIDRLSPIREEGTSRQDGSGSTGFQQQLSALRTPSGAGNSQGNPSSVGAQRPLPRARLNLPYRESALRDGPDFVRRDAPSAEIVAALAGAETRLPRTRLNLPYNESALRDGPDFVRDPSQDNPSLDFSTPPGALLSGIATGDLESRMNRPYNESALLVDARFAPLHETINRAVQEKAEASSPATSSEPYSRHHWRNI
ncbi:hypothetical protein AAFG07_11355 [Bradyrhizobium sp. B097]|uniref:hypothetical protein n=1 Tax=Bradyrhizobium sp. B097 TaxID=3140244 RepID=UPI0031835CF9